LLWSPDRKLLAGGCRDQTVKLWDAATLEIRGVFTNASRLLAFSADGKTIIMCFTNGTVNMRCGNRKVIRGFNAALA
jgi:WD40 repeat protein